MVNPCIEVAKENYHKIENKLKHTQKDSKVFCLFLQVFLNNKKIPIIPFLSALRTALCNWF